MLNQVVLVGRLTDTSWRDDESQRGACYMAIPRSYKNADGEYDTDFIPVFMPKNIYDNTMEYCRVGDIIGIKGRLEGNKDCKVVAEKVTFLSSKKSDED